MSDIELKTCPKCGIDRPCFERWLDEEGTSYKTYYRLHCHACMYTPDHWEESAEKAIEYWNARPLEDAANARAEAAEARAERLQTALDAANSALISMVYQYCYRPLDANKEPAIDIYQHDFMSAGEEAFAYLVEHGLAKWTDESHYAILINSKTSLSVKSDD